MKYKLVKYNENNNIKGYINVEGIYYLYNIMEDKLLKNHKKYLSVIEKNDEYKNLYDQLTKKINGVIEQKKYSSNNFVQTGGQAVLYLPFILSGASSGLMVCAVVGYIIYRFLTAPRCRPAYPISIDIVPQYKDIIFKLIPQEVFIKYLPSSVDLSNMDDTQLSETIKNSLNIFSIVLEIIAPDSIIGQLISGIVEVVAGVAVTVAEVVSAGALTAVNYLLKAFNLLKDAISFLLKFVNVAINITQILFDDDTKRILNDIFTIDFTDGPFGVKCWVEYIMNKYAKNTEFMKKICSIFNKILSAVYNKLISFISKAITFAVPEGGVAGTLFSTFISVLKCKTYDFALLRLNATYDKMSYDTQILFEKPLLMKKFLDAGIMSGKGFFDFINNNVIQKATGLVGGNSKINITSLYDFLIDNTYFFSYAINKAFAMVFTIMHILSMCSKLGFCNTLLDELKF